MNIINFLDHAVLYIIFEYSPPAPSFKSTTQFPSFNIFHPGTSFSPTSDKCLWKKLMSVIFYVPFFE